MFRWAWDPEKERDLPSVIQFIEGELRLESIHHTQHSNVFFLCISNSNYKIGEDVLLDQEISELG